MFKITCKFNCIGLDKNKNETTGWLQLPLRLPIPLKLSFCRITALFPEKLFLCQGLLFSQICSFLIFCKTSQLGWKVVLRKGIVPLAFNSKSASWTKYWNKSDFSIFFLFFFERTTRSASLLKRPPTCPEDLLMGKKHF